MKVLTLNYGRLTPNDEPYGDSFKQFEIQTFRIVWDGVLVTLKGADPSDPLRDEIYLQKTGGCFYYDGMYYSDLWVEGEDEISTELEVLDQAKAKAPADAHREYSIQTIIEVLKGLDNDSGVDGETMQYIIEKVGMESQMLRQLVLTADAEDTELLLEEKAILAGDKRLSREQLINRLAFITDDAKELGELLRAAKVDMNFCTNNAPIVTILSNIEIASNPNDSEPEEQQWITKKYYELGIDEGDDIGTRTLKTFDTEEEAVSLKKALEDMFPDMKLFVDTCTYDYMKRG